MKIVKVIKDSFQEYEGEWSLVLFSYGCNFACPDCYNLKYTGDPQNVIGNAIDILNKNLSPTHTAVVFLGGEPIIWGEELVEAAKYCKTKNLKVKLFTNGSRITIISDLVEKNLVDSYSIDFKAIKNIGKVIGRKCVDDKDYLKRLDDVIKLIIDSGKNLELRTTVWKTVEDLEELKLYVKTNYPSLPHIIQKPFKV